VQRNGWLGFTDKYWMTVLAPAPEQQFDAIYKAIPRTTPEFRTEMRMPVMSVGAGERAEMQTRIFSGAKEVETIRDYESELGIVRFEDSVDWGWFYFLTKPLFTVLHWLNGLIGNMGWAIIGLTFIIKAILFPLAYKSYVSMSKMKALQPEMEKIKERAGDDKQKLQQEMMALYKKEKVNPASGCLPILLQIPIFFSLYKVLFVTIEMRHAPFIGWIEDLSAPDPTSWMNLFGLLPYEIPGFLAIFSIGIYPILMGISMWLQQKLNPAPTDPTQQMIFAWMPWVFMFLLGQFAAGLVIYWLTNNIITILQQYIIMRSQGVEVDFFGNIKKSLKRKPAAAAAAGAGAGGTGGGGTSGDGGSSGGGDSAPEAADEAEPDGGGTPAPAAKGTPAPSAKGTNGTGQKGAPKAGSGGKSKRGRKGSGGARRGKGNGRDGESGSADSGTE
jgi:YidC/Oxa1 family membrane protein insertase